MGYSSGATGDFHAFMTGPNGVGMTALGTPDGNSINPTDINDAGQVVGWSPSGGQRGFITGPDGVGMTDLNSLPDVPAGFVITRALGINNAGQIIAVVDSIPPIPEPQSYALMLAGLGLIGFWAWRQKSGNRI
jgi:probable HAF family extracellular repeat protein